MDILFVAAELAPYANGKGPGDVVASLSKALRLLGHKVTIVLPRYAAFERSGLLLARRLSGMEVPATAAAPALPVTLYDGRLGSGVDLLLLDVPGFADRKGVYGEDGKPYPDNGARYATFCRAVAELVRLREASGTPFDVVHAHDWPTAMVPYLLQEAANAPHAHTVLTIHDLANQGHFPAEVLTDLGLGREHFHHERLEFYGMVSFLKGGVLSTDVITTVSTTYAREILTPELGERMDGVLRMRERDLTGIVSGIDYAVYSPTSDPALIARYDAEDAGNKRRCKSALLHELSLEMAPDRPLIAAIGHVSAQRGSDLLAAALPKILKSDVSVVIAGEGDHALLTKLEAAASKASERAVVLPSANEQLVHRILAGADVVLVPSRYEPCGLTQLYAQRYGALPVAHRTGGLIDTIVDCDASLETGTGFLFDKPTATSLVGGVQRALAAITSPRWGALRRRVMRLDLGWDKPARRYAHVYRAAIAKG